MPAPLPKPSPPPQVSPCPRGNARTQTTMARANHKQGEPPRVRTAGPEGLGRHTSPPRISAPRAPCFSATLSFFPRRDTNLEGRRGQKDRRRPVWLPAPTPERSGAAPTLSGAPGWAWATSVPSGHDASGHNRSPPGERVKAEKKEEAAGKRNGRSKIERAARCFPTGTGPRCSGGGSPKDPPLKATMCPSLILTGSSAHCGAKGEERRQSF